MSYLEELLPEFRKGAKIRRTDWDKGRYLYYENGAIYDENNSHYQLSGFDINSYCWQFYQEPIDYDYIIKNKCLCWFWDNQEDDGMSGILVGIEKKTIGKFITFGKTWWINCRPVRRDEVTFYEDRENA